MNKAWIGLIILAFSINLVAANYIVTDYATETSVGISLNLPDTNFQQIKMEDGNLYSRLQIAGVAHPESGKPNVPLFGSWLLIPNGSTPVLQIFPGDPIIYNDIELAPVQLPAPDIVDEKKREFVKDVYTYNLNSAYPAEFAVLEPTMQKRGQDCTIVWIQPYHYYPANRKLEIYPDLKVEISFTGTINAPASNLKIDKNLFTNALNADPVLEAAQVRIDNTTPQNRNDRDNGCELLIVSAPEFENAAHNLATWKTQSGITSQVALTSEIGTTKEEIRNYIRDGYMNWEQAPAYLILLGDAEFIPTWYQNIHPSDADYNQGHTASDLYYADMAPFFDLIADLSYGRIPVDTSAQADSVVARIIEYETNPPTDPSFYSKMTAAAYFQDEGQGYAERRFSKTAEDLRNFLTETGYDVERIYTTESYTYPLYWNTNNYVFENDIAGGPIPDELRKPTFPWNGNYISLINKINDGTFFLLHRDHGYRGGWGDPAFSISNVNNLSNASKLPIVWTINCETGWFDNETDDSSCGTNFGSESFTEAWMRHSTGGSVGLIASTRVSYSGNNDRIVWGFMDAIWPNFLNWCTADYPDHAPIYRMGDVLNYGKEYMMQNYTWGDDIRRCTIEQFQWFGDPTMEIWTEVPQLFTVSHPEGIELGSTTLSVNCDVDGAFVNLSRNGEILANGQTFGGYINLNFPAITSLDDLNLVITAHNYIPYQAVISSNPIDAFIVCNSAIFTENGDYNDGLIQSLDIVDISVLLENIGIMDTSENVSAILSCESNLITILIEEINFGIINEGAELVPEPEFKIELGQGIEDLSIIQFQLEICSDSLTWYDSFDMEVHAPVLAFSHFQYTMNMGSDQILDPGESASLYLSYLNSGTGNSYDLTTTLFSYDPYVTVSGMDVINYIPAGEIGTTSSPFTIELSEACPIDYYLTLQLLILDALGANQSAEFSIPVGMMEYTFENNSSTWENEALDEGYLNQWHLSDFRNSTPEGSFSMKCGEEGGSPYSNMIYAALIMPDIELAEHTVVRFMHWMDTGILEGNQTWDGGIIQLSMNGEDFVQITPTNGYNAFMINLPGHPFEAGTEVFAGEILWEEVEVDLQEYSGTATLRFVFASSPSFQTAEGWYLDDFQIINYNDTGLEELVPVQTNLRPNYPNPFNPSGTGRTPTTTISFSLAKDSKVNLDIYNIRGQKIKTLVNSALPAMNHNIDWNGKNDNNKTVASGIYFYRLRTDSYNKTRKMMLLK